jgi:hypothetical protein
MRFWVECAWGTGHETISTFVILLLVANTALADQLPQRKPGLWQVTMSMQGKTVPVSRLCIDAATESALEAVGLSVSNALLFRGVGSYPTPRPSYGINFPNEPWAG